MAGAVLTPRRSSSPKEVRGMETDMDTVIEIELIESDADDLITQYVP
ncbi:hypothetical protein QMZ92_01260 [Streptomyces sp. HNM0645]|nr:hypothetical protein [Streptomyces sp. HNM0645]MDI9883062.1 hypothetical protein [Streptomyces sp. HNM0645]